MKVRNVDITSMRCHLNSCKHHTGSWPEFISCSRSLLNSIVTFSCSLFRLYYLFECVTVVFSHRSAGSAFSITPLWMPSLNSANTSTCARRRSVVLSWRLNTQPGCPNSKIQPCHIHVFWFHVFGQIKKFKQFNYRSKKSLSGLTWLVI